MERVMTTNVDLLEAEALQLPPADRARLVERLIASLDADPEVEEAWAAEVERRNAEIENGEVFLVPGSEALAELKAQFR
jgi:putative addiction module component (TIGR02574 family)